VRGTLLFAVIAVLICGVSGARSQDGYPFSIMKAEPDTKPAAKPKVKPKSEPKPADTPAKKQATRKSGKKARGSSTLSTVPTYRSTVTPLGKAPDIIETPPMGRAASPGL
jgi:hypothetical protein